MHRGGASMKINMRYRALALALAVLAGAPPRAHAATPVLVWSDEFNQAAGTQPDPAKWAYDLGAGNPAGWGNNELESYTSSASNAQIVADPNATDGKALAIPALKSSGAYTSARIYTNSSFTACRLEARARMPAGAGVWPAFWALGSNINTVGWPACGEIDVMEWGGSSLTPGDVQGSLHAPNYNPTTVYPLANNARFNDAYHVFAADCYPNEIVFSVDGTVYEDLKESAQPAGATWPFDAPFFILLNLAVGGNYPASPAGTAFPQTYLVDYVRVYSLPSAPPPNLVWAPAPPANIVAYSPAASQISVSWQAPPGTLGAGPLGHLWGSAHRLHAAARKRPGIRPERHHLEPRHRRLVPGRRGSTREHLLLPGLRRQHGRHLGPVRHRAIGGPRVVGGFKADRHCNTGICRNRRQFPYRRVRGRRPRRKNGAHSRLGARPRGQSLQCPGHASRSTAAALQRKRRPCDQRGMAGQRRDRRRSLRSGCIHLVQSHEQRRGTAHDAASGAVHGDRFRDERGHGRGAPGSVRRAVGGPERGQPRAADAPSRGYEGDGRRTSLCPPRAGPHAAKERKMLTLIRTKKCT